MRLFFARPSSPLPRARAGLCTALVWANKGGWEIMGSDIFPDYVDRINKKTLHSLEPEVTDYLKACTKLTVGVQQSLWQLRVSRAGWAMPCPWDTQRASA